MAANEKMFSVDKFLGLNQSGDGFTELGMGEASEMNNFFITDGFNLKTRPGIIRMPFYENRENGEILACWAGYISTSAQTEYLVVVDFYNGHDRIFWCSNRESHMQENVLGLTSTVDHYVKIFPFGGKVWILSRNRSASFRGDGFQPEDPYIPLVIAGATPTGGGTILEKINLLTAKRRITYSADGEAKEYVLPEEAQSVEKILLDGIDFPIANAGSYNQETHTFTFKEVPIKGVGNLEFTYSGYAADAESTRLTILSMPLVEAYNGATDTRLFVGGVGNVCYYTGVTENGEATPLYFPAMNDVSVDMTGSSVTGLVRHFSRLLVFTKDGTYALSYEPVTLPGGDVTAGFYLRAVNREFGNDVLGQVQTVDNYPRTITSDGVFQWMIPSSYGGDERYARRVSDRVSKYMRRTDTGKIVTCDDSMDRTYYVFLNDENGTVLVNRYGLSKEQVWCVYTSELTQNVQSAFLFGGKLCFSNGRELFRFEESAPMDAPRLPDGESANIYCLWKSGFLNYGAEFRRKFASEIYVSMLPESNCGITVTAETDRRSEYAKKSFSYNIFHFDKLDFRTFTFYTNDTPKIKRIRIKLKKFVYCRLIMEVTGNGQTATVLGYDHKVRFGSMAK